MIHGEHYEGLTQTRVYSAHRETRYDEGRLSGEGAGAGQGVLECMLSPQIYTVFAALILHTPSVQAQLVNVYR